MHNYISVKLCISVKQISSNNLVHTCTKSYINVNQYYKKILFICLFVYCTCENEFSQYIEVYAFWCVQAPVWFSKNFQAHVVSPTLTTKNVHILVYVCVYIYLCIYKMPHAMLCYAMWNMFFLSFLLCVGFGILSRLVSSRFVPLLIFLCCDGFEVFC